MIKKKPQDWVGRPENPAAFIIYIAWENHQIFGRRLVQLGG
jgi:hypothetical protein